MRTDVKRREFWEWRDHTRLDLGRHLGCSGVYACLNPPEGPRRHIPPKLAMSIFYPNEIREFDQ
jgi:hypothetical protein